MILSAAAWSDMDILAEPQFVPARDAVSYIVVGERGTRLKVIPIAGGAARALPLDPPLIAVTEAGLGAYGWTPDGGRVVYISADGRLCLHNVESGGTMPLTTNPLPLSGLAVSPQGDSAAVVVDTQTVCLLSLGDPGAELHPVSETVDFALDPAWSPDGTVLAWHEWDAPHMPWQSSRIVMRRLGRGEAPIVLADRDCAVGQPRFSPDGRWLSFLSDHTGWLTLWAQDLDAGLEADPVRLASAEAEHAPPSWGPGLRNWTWSGDAEVVVWRNDNGCGSLERWANGSKSEVLRDGVFANGVAARGELVLAVLGGPLASSRIEVLQSGRSTVLAYSAAAAVDRAGCMPETVSWISDGWTIHARLYRPSKRSDAPPPLLVWLHQGPTGQALGMLDPRIAYFVERGWAVLAPDHRGSTGWGRDFMRTLEGAWGEADVADVAVGVEMAVRECWGRPDSVVFYGGSAGGFLTLRLLEMRPDLCAAGVALFPVCHLLDLCTPPWRYQTHYVEQLVGGRRAERSPLQNANKIKRPVLILHGSEDHIVPAWHSDVLAKAINVAGGWAERRVFPGEGHGWTRGATLAEELRSVERFLDCFVLSPIHGPSAGRAGIDSGRTSGEEG